MNDVDIGYRGEDEHTHAQRVPFIVWALLGCVIILAFTIIGLSTYLIERASLADGRVERQRQAICAVLATIPGHVHPEITQARQAFARRDHPTDCFYPATAAHHPAPAITLAPAPSPAAATPPAASRRPTPAPTVTRTIRPTPLAAPSSTPTHRPSPTPSPTTTCTVHIGPVCV